MHLVGLPVGDCAQLASFALRRNDQEGRHSRPKSRLGLCPLASRATECDSRQGAFPGVYWGEPPLTNRGGNVDNIYCPILAEGPALRYLNSPYGAEAKRNGFTWENRVVLPVDNFAERQKKKTILITNGLKRYAVTERISHRKNCTRCIKSAPGR
jgi:hypothetical protein